MLKYIFISIVFIMLTSCSNTHKPETNNDIVWLVDLDNDGIMDKIIVDILNDNNTGEGARISIYKGDSGLLIYSASADLPHIGWNGLYLFQDENGSQIFSWHPTIYQGLGSFHYELFSFDAKGNKTVLDSSSFEFSMDAIRSEHSGLDEFVEYIQSVNSYLMQSSLIAETDGGILLYGTQNNPTVKMYIPDWLFYS